MANADECLYSLFTQELPSEEVQEDLIEKGQSEEILQKSCPFEYRELKEEEVTTFGFCYSSEV